MYVNRIGKVGNQKRVVGVLLGSWHKKILDVSNSFAGKCDCDSSTILRIAQHKNNLLYGKMSVVHQTDRLTIHTSILTYRHERIPNFITSMLWSYVFVLDSSI